MSFTTASRNASTPGGSHVSPNTVWKTIYERRDYLEFEQSAGAGRPLSSCAASGEPAVPLGRGPAGAREKEIPGVELDIGGNIISYDIETQCHSVFRNVRYILDDAGSGWDKIVDVTVFLTNMEADFPAYNRIYAEYFKDNQPCRTTIEISRLPTPIAIELKVIATID